MARAGLSRLAAALAAAGLWLAAPAWAADDEPPIGAKLEGVMSLAGRQIPLPAGSWTLAGRSFEPVPELGDDAYGAIETEVLFRIEDDTVVAFLIAHRNLLPVEEGWGTASECIGEIEVPVVVSYDSSAAHTFCGFASRFDTGVEVPVAGSWKQAEAYAEAQGLALPKHWLMAGFRLSNAQDVLEVRYNFAAALAEDQAAIEPPASSIRLAAAQALAVIIPAAAPQQASVAAPADQGSAAAAAGAGWWGSLEGMMPGWLGGGSAGPDEYAGAINGLSDWLKVMRGPVQLGFNNELSGRDPPPMPWTAATGEAQPGEPDKLAQLDALKQAGVIDQARFEEQSRLIAADTPREAEAQISSGNLTLIKVLADQATAAVPTFIGNWIVLGTVPQAATLLGIQTAVDFFHDYSTELAWNIWGPQRIREEPTIDFPGAGQVPGADND
ncbi:MAG: hypothetical protein U1E53_11260 [Dongiaceae bacterium]